MIMNYITLHFIFICTFNLNMSPALSWFLFSDCNVEVFFLFWVRKFLLSSRHGLDESRIKVEEFLKQQQKQKLHFPFTRNDNKGFACEGNSFYEAMTFWRMDY